MEIKTTAHRLGTVRTVYDGYDERPLDCNFALPDYLPEIAAVLKCCVTPTVQTYQVSGDRVAADGTVTLRLLYLDESRDRVHGFEYTQPFSSSFTMPEPAGDETFRLSSKVNYVNCRATGPRRAEVQGSLGVHLTVKGTDGTQVLDSAEGEGVCSRGTTVNCTVPLRHAEKAFTTNEVAELKETASELLRARAAVCHIECKPLPGKAIVKGTISVWASYTAEDGNIGHFEGQLPFSQILDSEGMTEETACDVTGCILLCDARIMPNGDDENRLLSLTVKTGLQLQTYAATADTVLTDAFHTRYPLRCETARIQPCCVLGVRNETAVTELALELPEGAGATVEDVWSESGTYDVRCEEGKTVIRGTLTVGLLTRDSEGHIAYFERPADYTLEPDEPCEQEEITVTPLCITASEGARPTFRAQLCLHRIGMRIGELTALTEITADESAPFAETMPGCQVKLCFAEAGDTVWNLAETEHISPQRLREENALENETIESDTVLLVPIG